MTNPTNPLLAALQQIRNAGSLEQAKTYALSALSYAPAVGEAVAWMYDHPDYAGYGIKPVVQLERADPEKVAQGYIETPLGKIAHPTAAVAGEGEVERIAKAMAPNAWLDFDPKLHGSPVNQEATKRRWLQHAANALAALSQPAGDALAEPVKTVMARCEALEDEAAEQLVKSGNEHAEGWWRGQKHTAKSIRRELHDLTRSILASTKSPDADGGANG